MLVPLVEVRGEEGDMRDDRNVYLDLGVIHLDTHIFVNLLELFNSYMCIFTIYKIYHNENKFKKTFPGVLMGYLSSFSGIGWLAEVTDNAGSYSKLLLVEVLYIWGSLHAMLLTTLLCDTCSKIQMVQKYIISIIVLDIFFLQNIF